MWPDVQAAAAEAVKTGERVEPGEAMARYEPVYQLYRDLYPMLKPAFDRQASL